MNPNSLQNNAIQRTPDVLIKNHIKILDHLTESIVLDKFRDVEERELVVDSALRQLDLFGYERWRNSFKRIITILPDDYDAKLVRSVRAAERKRFQNMQEIFSKVPAKVRLFQEIFTEPQEVITTRPGVSQIPLKNYLFACFVSPKLISDTLVTKLRLCDFTDCNRKPITRFAMKSDPYVIAALRLIYFNMEPIKGSAGRLYILKEVHSPNSTVNNLLEKYNSECVGKVVMVSSIGIPETIFEGATMRGFYINRKRMSIYDSVNDALRALIIIRKGYDAEAKMLTKFATKIEELGEQLLLWRKDADKRVKEQIAKSVIAVCDDISSQLAKVINRHKQSAGNLLRETLISQQKKSNPWAYILKLSAVIRRLNKRLDEFSAISSYEGQDKIQATKAIERAHLKCDAVLNKVSYWLKFLKDISSVSSDDISDMRYSLSYVVNNLKDIQYSPYKELSLKIRDSFSNIISLLSSNLPFNKEKIQSELVRINFYCVVEKHVLRNIYSLLMPDRTLANIKVFIGDAISNLEKMEQDLTFEKELKDKLDVINNLIKSVNGKLTSLNKSELNRNLADFPSLKDEFKKILNEILSMLK